MADAISDQSVTLELHGALADRLADLGTRRGARTLVRLPLTPDESTVSSIMHAAVENDARYGTLFDAASDSFPEHVEVILNDRVLDLQGGVNASLRPGDVLTFVPAHAGG